MRLSRPSFSPEPLVVANSAPFAFAPSESERFSPFEAVIAIIYINSVSLACLTRGTPSPRSPRGIRAGAPPAGSSPTRKCAGTARRTESSSNSSSFG